MCVRKSYLISPVPDLGSHEGTSRPHPFHQNVVSLQPFRFQLLDVIGHKVVGFCELSDPKKKNSIQVKSWTFQIKSCQLRPLSHCSFLKFWVSATCSSRTFCSYVGSYVGITFAIEGLQIIGLCSGLWAGRDLYHITPAVTQGQLSSCGLILYDHNNLKAFHNKDIST